MIDLDDAQRHVLSRISVLDTVDVAVVEAAGMVLAVDVVAPAAVPPFANSAMDGVAVRSADLAEGPTTLRLVGTIAAGEIARETLGAGEAMRIMTGAPVPEGADAVVMVELCEFAMAGAADGAVGGSAETVTVASSVPLGNHIRPVGDDVAAGDVVLSRGALVTPGAISLLRTLGLSTVSVVRRPVVGVISTGSELVEPPTPLGPGQIYDSNRAAVLALVSEAGFEAVDLGLVDDSEPAIEAALRRGAATCDAVLSSGGVSMGDFDFVKSVLDRIGDMTWMQIAIRPAKPFAFGTIATEGRRRGEGRPIPVFGLPGNPVSSMVSFELLALPALRAMAGHARPDRPVTTVTAAEDFRRNPDGKTHFPRVVVSAAEGGSLSARSAGGQGSHHLAAMAVANAYAVLPDGPGVRAGEPMTVLLVQPLA